MPVDPDPRTHVNSSTDFYALLELSPTFSTPAELRQAYRKGSRKYHPDKAVRPDASDAEKERAREQWDLFEVAVKLLEDPSLRSQYDNARTAREQRRQRDAKNDAIRQAMVDRLEKGERAAKQKSADEMDMDAEARELRMLADMGRRAREALAAKWRAQDRELYGDDEAERGSGAMPATSRSRSPRKETIRPFPTREQDEKPLAPEERTIQVRWPADTKVELDRLERVFSRFGAIDAALLGKTKNERLGDSREKRPVSRGFIQFQDKTGAYDAVFEWKRERDSGDSQDWEGIEDVTWLTKSPPTWVQAERERRSRSDGMKPATPAAAPLRSSRNPRDFLKPPPGYVPKIPASALRTWKNPNGIIPQFPSYKAALEKQSAL